MNVFRLNKEKYRKDLSGQGAQIAGGRWNSVGVPMIYTSQSRSLSTAEVAVNLPLGDVPGGFEITTINIPDDCKLGEILVEDLPPRRKTFQPSTITQKIGDQFIIQGKYLVMKVPSAIVPGILIT
jgi:RES domain-containing protein